MQFITKDFLLQNEAARHLYYEYASRMPIIDYHCHIPIADVAEDKQFRNLTEVWISDDHYKWTAMRWCGVSEKYITGDASDLEKFLAYVKILPSLIGNPLHHWSHLEIATYFDFFEHLTQENAKSLWVLANEKLQHRLSARTIIEQSNVKIICTTDDPLDDLQYHDLLANSDCSFSIYPTFRPDRVIAIEQKGFVDYVHKLSEVVGYSLDTLNNLLQALNDRLDYFDLRGCRLSDHALSEVQYAEASIGEIDSIFKRRMLGEVPDSRDVAKFQTAILVWLAQEYRNRGWAMQLHFGVVRNINPKLFSTLGVDAGGDAIGGYSCIPALARLLERMEREEGLPKMILYSIDPNDNAAIGSLSGCFQSDEAKGKIQHGSAWWFNDTEHGMEEHLRTLASLGSLGSFIGMLTDSRSLLSYTRHDYFRRIFCNFVGNLVETGRYPRDYGLLGELVKDVCYNNIKKYLNIKE